MKLIPKHQTAWGNLNLISKQDAKNQALNQIQENEYKKSHQGLTEGQVRARNYASALSLASPAVGYISAPLGVAAGVADLGYDIEDAVQGRTSPMHAVIDVVGMGAGPLFKAAKKTKPVIDDIVSYSTGAISSLDDALQFGGIDLFSKKK